MLEAPTNRRDDPRARRYIVDHLPPGETITRQLLVTNRTEERRRIDVYPAAATLEENKFTFGEGRAANELTSWISLDRTTVELGPQAETRVRATIRVPPAASAGERYGVIWASTTSLPRPGGQVTQTHRVGVRMYLDIGPGGEPPSDFTIGDLIPARSPQGEPSVAIGVTNTGGRALDLTGKVALTEGPAGTRAGPFDVVQGTTLAPGQSGQVTARFPAELSNGPWTLQVDLESGRVKKTATGRIEFPDPGETGKPGTFLSQLVTWWNVAIAAAGVLVVAGLTTLARRYRRRILVGR
ncbi:hypothetical protein CA850_16855 [Micromonospora echinospora]|uniref:Uncharacterized protein n=1 Tax=Micromonospora echinospora TaxID=1877 RepID=A0A1C4WUA6_MICEC|nr:hypothetical protein CA850_16855 [Micromonospora echinospora]SCE99876.1 hypothetical protein GA0070618_2508 [Micromonospora echinospora]